MSEQSEALVVSGDPGAAPEPPASDPTDPLAADPRSRDAARQLLIDVVAAQRSSGHVRSTAAGVSSHMRAASPTFSHVLLEFQSFRDFLKDAADHEIVSVSWPEPKSGLDAYIWLPGEDQRPPLARSTERPRRIRPELWRAFMNWDPAVRRYWDRRDRQLLETSNEPGSDGNLVPITPVSVERQIEWMTAFTADLDSAGKERAALQSALETTRPAAAFVAVTRQFSAIDTRWRDTLVRHVSDVIEGWKATNKLSIDIFEDDAHKPSQSQRAGRTSRGSGELSDGDIRERVVAAVRAMPISDVLQLRIPVEYLLRQ